MSARPWYKWFPGDYLQDTVHISPEADLLYRRLLDVQWRDGIIPLELEKIARISRLPMAWVEPAWPEIEGYFQRVGGRKPGYSNKRMKSLIALCSRESGVKRDAAKRRWNKELHASALNMQCDPDPDPDPEEEEEKRSPPIVPPLPEKPAPKSAPKRARFQRPDVSAVRAYCQERNNHVDAVAFIDHYESKGWVVGKSPMKDWKAAVRTWERNAKNRNGGKNGSDYDRPIRGSYDWYAERDRQREQQRLDAGATGEVLESDDGVVWEKLED